MHNGKKLDIIDCWLIRSKYGPIPTGQIIMSNHLMVFLLIYNYHYVPENNFSCVIFKDLRGFNARLFQIKWILPQNKLRVALISLDKKSDFFHCVNQKNWFIRWQYRFLPCFLLPAFSCYQELIKNIGSICEYSKNMLNRAKLFIDKV